MNKQYLAEYLDGRMVVKVGDITAEKVDVIVNAANHSLMGGGGVDGAIHRKGGSGILEECKEIRNTEYIDGLPEGEAVATRGGNLAAQYVIHTVGPVWKGGAKKESEKLEECYWNSLLLAEKKGSQSVAFPAISTGIYRFPKELAAEIVFRTIGKYFKERSGLKKVVLVFFIENDANIFIKNQKIKP